MLPSESPISSPLHTKNAKIEAIKEQISSLVSIFDIQTERIDQLWHDFQEALHAFDENNSFLYDFNDYVERVLWADLSLSMIPCELKDIVSAILQTLPQPYQQQLFTEKYLGNIIYESTNPQIQPSVKTEIGIKMPSKREHAGHLFSSNYFRINGGEYPLLSQEQKALLFERLPHLTQISFDNALHMIPKEDLESIFQGQKVKWLGLDKSWWDKRWFHVLKHFLPNLTNLKYLIKKGEDKHFSKENLPWFSTLIWLKALSLCQLGLQNYPRKAREEIFHFPPELRALSLNDNQLFLFENDELRGLFQHARGLRCLELSGCEIASVPAWVLQEMFAPLSELRHLNLSYTKPLSTEQVKAMFSPLTKLRSLNLTRSQIENYPPIFLELIETLPHFQMLTADRINTSLSWTKNPSQ